MKWHNALRSYASENSSSITHEAWAPVPEHSRADGTERGMVRAATDSAELPKVTADGTERGIVRVATVSAGDTILPLRVYSGIPLLGLRFPIDWMATSSSLVAFCSDRHTARESFHCSLLGKT